MASVRVVNDEDLDERMTDETKAFVTNFLKTTNPRAILAVDINVVRQIRHSIASALNSQLKFDNLELKEYFADSLYDEYKIPFTAYIPKETKSNVICIFFHGGGGSLGTRVTYNHTVSALADQTKCIWLSVEYRLAPEHKFPVGGNDCFSVTKWVLSNKTSVLGLDENVKVGLVGESFGGGVSCYIAHQLKSEIAFQILVYPAIDTNLKTESEKEFTRDCFILIPEVIKLFSQMLFNKPEDSEDPRASPNRYADHTNTPNTLIIAAQLDPIYDHSVIYHQKLLENNCKSELKVIKGVHHGFFNVPSGMPKAFAETAYYITNFINSII